MSFSTVYKYKLIQSSFYSTSFNLSLSSIFNKPIEYFYFYITQNSNSKTFISNHIIKLLEEYKIGTIVETFNDNNNNDNNPNPNPNPNVFDNVKNTKINFNLLQNSLTLPYKNKIINACFFCFCYRIINKWFI